MALTGHTGIVANMTMAANLSRRRLVGFNGNYCVANAKAAGVLIEDSLSGEQGPVDTSGICVVETAGAFSVGDPLVASGAGADAGRVAEATTFSVTVGIPVDTTPVTSDAAQPDLTETLAGSVLPQAINGYAMDASTGAGEFVRMRQV